MLRIIVCHLNQEIPKFRPHAAWPPSYTDVEVCYPSKGLDNGVHGCVATLTLVQVSNELLQSVKYRWIWKHRIRTQEDLCIFISCTATVQFFKMIYFSFLFFLQRSFLRSICTHWGCSSFFYIFFCLFFFHLEKL